MKTKKLDLVSPPSLGGQVVYLYPPPASWAGTSGPLRAHINGTMRTLREGPMTAVHQSLYWARHEFYLRTGTY